MQGFCEWCNQEVPYGVDGRCFLGHPASALRKGSLTGTMQTIVEPPVDTPRSAVAEAMDDVTASAVDRDTSDLLAATLASALAGTDTAAGEVETFEIPESVEIADDAAAVAATADAAGLDEELSPGTVFGTAHPAGDDGDAGVAFGVPDAVEQWSAIPMPDTDIPVYEYRPPKRDTDTDSPRATVATLARPVLSAPLTGLETVPDVPAFVTFGVDTPTAAAPTIDVAPVVVDEVVPLPVFAHEASEGVAAADVRRGTHELGADVRLRVMLAVLAVVAVVAAVYAAVMFG